ncbi:hypothetical protein [Cellulomonas endometrii]|uniref:hypothetical protein n=1 Tax=Cellulomonas endometrii TaxID=3036301 RepID=UPI0024AD6CEB|nr:hypothetical protein [Cellulomonas endometrii]
MDEPRAQQPDPAPGDDEAFARLRAADPAAGAGLDTAALRAEVARRSGAEPAGDVAPVTTLASRRRARWLQVAAVGVGAALVAGAGGYAAGARGGGEAAAAPIMLGQAAAEQQLAGAADKLAAGSTATDMRIAPGFGARAVFSASGLADDASAAHAWALDAAAVFSAETAARVASALGVTGDPSQQYGAWTVGPQDGTAPNVTLQPDGAASISYYDPTRDPWACAASATDQPDAGASDGAGTTEGSAAAELAPTIDPELVDPALPVVPGPTCDPALGDAPTGDAAVAATRDLLATLGVDPAAFEYEEGDSGTTAAATVTAYQVVDAQRTGLAWNVTLVDGGVQSLYGSLAPLVDLGEYPVVGAATAVERLNDPRFGTGYGGVMPLARAEAADAAGAAEAATTDEVPSGDPTVPATAQPGSPISWPVQQVTITGARLGLAMVTQADGAALLVPAYELTDADGSAWSVVAVDEGSLDLAG